MSHYGQGHPVEVIANRQFTVSTMNSNMPGRSANNSTPASQAWLAANEAIYVPIFFTDPCIVYRVGVGAGGTAGGNFDIGLYDMAGTKLQSTGTQVRTLSAFNQVDWTDLTVFPGWYYAALSADSTANYSGVAPAAGLCEAAGVCKQATAFTLPATATLTRTDRALIPGIVFTVRSIAV